MTKKIELLICDLDGTLIDSAADIANVLKEVLVENNLANRVSDQRLQHAARHGVLTLFKELCVEESQWQELYEKFKTTYFAYGMPSTRLYPEVDTTLAKLKKRLQLVIWTNKLEHFTALTVKKLQLTQYFEAIYCNESFPEKKPSGIPIIQIMNNCSVKADQAMIVGDTENDLLAGREANIKTCYALYGYGFNNAKLQGSLAPNYKIKSFSKLLKIIQ